MPLHYERRVDLGVENVICLAFSTSGSNLAAITGDGLINVWDVATGKRYYPSPKRSLVHESCLSWLDDAIFVCGFADGSLLTGYVNPDGVEEMDIQQVKVSNSAILALEFNPEAGLLAIGGRDGIVRFWLRSHLNWIYIKSLPEMPDFPLDYGKIISLSWLTNVCNELLVGYENKGLVVWDVAELVLKRSLENRPGRRICKGTFCSSINKFVAINDLDSIDVYDISSGQFWTPSTLNGVYAVKSIGTGFVAGRVGKSELVDIVGTCVGQVLCEGQENASKITAIDVCQSDAGGGCVIATASAATLQIWAGQGRKVMTGGGETNESHRKHNEVLANPATGLLSFFYGTR